MDKKLNKIIIASDHAGFEMKEFIIKRMKEYDFEDIGTNSEISVDYPDYAIKLTQQFSPKQHSIGVLICGSGIGMSMGANRVKNIRAALCSDHKMAILARQHNDANVLVLGSRLISLSEAIKCLLAFLNTNFDGGRHQGRLSKFNDVDL